MSLSLVELFAMTSLSVTEGEGVEGAYPEMLRGPLNIRDRICRTYTLIFGPSLPSSSTSVFTLERMPGVSPLILSLKTFTLEKDIHTHGFIAVILITLQSLSSQLRTLLITYYVEI